MYSWSLRLSKASVSREGIGLNFHPDYNRCSVELVACWPEGPEDHSVRAEEQKSGDERKTWVSAARVLSNSLKFS